MKNFETLYKLLMNEAEYEDVQELEGVESELSSDITTDDDLTEKGKKIKEFSTLFPTWTREKIENAINAGFEPEDFPQGESVGEVDVDALDVPDEDDEFGDPLDAPSEDDWPDIPAYTAQRRQDTAESGY